MSDVIGRDLDRMFDVLRKHLPHHGYHQPQQPQEDTMGLLTTVEAEVHKLAAHARQIEQEVLPSIATDAQKAEALLQSPAAEALLGALHVPADAILKAVVPIINWLADAYEKPAPVTEVPAEPVPG